MNDPHIDELVGAASLATDTRVGTLPVEQGEAELRDAIVATGHATESTGTSRPGTARRARRLVAAAAAVAVLGAAVVVTDLANDGSGTSSSVVTRTAPVDDARLIAFANASPRLLLGEDWSVVDAAESQLPDGVLAGRMEFRRGAQVAVIEWADADLWRDPYESDGWHRADTTVLGNPAAVYSQVLGTPDFELNVPITGSIDARVVWEQGGSYLTLRTYVDSNEELEQVLAQLRQVDSDTFVTESGLIEPSELPALVESTLAGIIRPDGFDHTEVAGNHDLLARNHLARRVALRLTCAWGRAWVAALDAGDDAAVQQAVDAMAVARDWPFLEESGVADDVQHVADRMRSDPRGASDDLRSVFDPDAPTTGGLMELGADGTYHDVPGGPVSLFCDA